MFAAGGGHDAIVKQLLAFGANVEAANYVRDELLHLLYTVLFHCLVVLFVRDEAYLICRRSDVFYLHL